MNKEGANNNPRLNGFVFFVIVAVVIYGIAMWHNAKKCEAYGRACVGKTSVRDCMPSTCH